MGYSKFIEPGPRIYEATNKTKMPFFELLKVIRIPKFLHTGYLPMFIEASNEAKIHNFKSLEVISSFFKDKTDPGNYVFNQY